MLNNLPCLLLRLLRHAGAVGTHVGNQANAAICATYIDAFIQSLRQGHGFFGAETKLAAGFLLERAGGKGRGGVAALVFAGDFLNLVAGMFEFGHNVTGLLLIFNCELI